MCSSPGGGLNSLTVPELDPFVKLKEAYVPSNGLYQLASILHPDSVFVSSEKDFPVGLKTMIQVPFESRVAVTR